MNIKEIQLTIIFQLFFSFDLFSGSVSIIWMYTKDQKEFLWERKKRCLKIAQESISPTYYVQLLRRYFCAKKVQTLNLSTKKLGAKLSYKKAARIMLVKLTPDLSPSQFKSILQFVPQAQMSNEKKSEKRAEVDFTNILRPPFMQISSR